MCIRDSERIGDCNQNYYCIAAEGGAEFVNLLSALDGVRGVISVQRIQS